MNDRFQLLNFVFLITLSCINVHAETVSGGVTRVVDGDTLYVFDDMNTYYKIRLAGIDAPERGQPFSEQSKSHLNKLLVKTSYRVRIKYDKRDQYGHIVGTVFSTLDENQQPKAVPDDLNGTMVRSGYAWADRENSTKYTSEERSARKDKVGLWAGKNPIPPWEWRRLNGPYRDPAWLE